MSGPALERRESHHAIHEAAFNEAQELTIVLRQLLRQGDLERALAVAGVLLEHWQTRTLRHAETEEIGWYQQLLMQRPELQSDIVLLTRDHDLLRILLAEIQEILRMRGVAMGVVERFEAMLLINHIHSREEESRLLGGGRDEATSEQEVPLVKGHPAPGRISMPTSQVVPLAIARPDQYQRYMAYLQQHGLHPGDLQLDVSSNAETPSLLAALGRDFSQVIEMPLPAEDDEPGNAALERTLAEACEQAARSDYDSAMRTADIRGATASAPEQQVALKVIQHKKDKR